MPSPRSPRWIWALVALVAIAEVVVAIAAGPGVFDHLTTTPPFDLRTVGESCPDSGGWVCGSVTVPFDRRAPTAGSITVRFRVLPREQTSKASAGTIVVLAGGPGQSTMAQYQSAANLFRSARTDHDILLVDNRGTGESRAVNCPELQEKVSHAAVAQCRQLLGAHADDYGTVAVADDLEAVLNKIHAGAVDLYGESYGTYVAQVFALRHPQHVQRIVLDGAVPLDVDGWRRDSVPAALAALKTVCDSDSTCRAGRDPLALLPGSLSIIRFGTSAEHSTLDSASDLAKLLERAGTEGTAYRELSAALRAMATDPTPMIRLLSEIDTSTNGTTVPSVQSDGLLFADTCADFPQPFDLRAPLAEQKRQLAAATKREYAATAHALLPFTPQEVLANQTLCLGWPAPADPPPRSDKGFPNVPTLVLEGGLDTVTPPAVARSVAAAIPHSRYIEVPFVGHVAALADPSRCAGSIAGEFVAAKPVQTACLARIVPPPQVDAFPETFAQERPVRSIPVARASGLPTDARRTLALTRDVISDVLWRWDRLDQGGAAGLRGGTFTTVAPAAPEDFTVHLDGIQWTSDTTVTGDITIAPKQGVMDGSLVVTTPAGQAHLEVRSPSIFGPTTRETLTGTIGPDVVDVTVDAKLGL